MAMPSISSFPKFTLPDFFPLQQSTKIWLSICLIILTSIWRHSLTSSGHNPLPQEVWIEWLSWIIILAAYKVFSLISPNQSNHTCPSNFWKSPSALWLSATALLSSQLLSSQDFPSWIMPLTTITVTYTSSFHSSSKTELSQNPQEKQGISRFSSIPLALPAALQPSQISTVVILNILTIIAWTLYNGYPINTISPFRGLAFLFLRTAAVFSIARFQDAETSNQEQGQEEEQDLLPDPGNLTFLSQVSIPMVSLLTCILIFKRPDLNISSLEVLGQALAQAIWWYAFVDIIELQMPITAVNLDTLSLSIETAFQYSSAGYTIVPALSVLLTSAVQVILLLRTNLKARQAVYIAVLAFGLVLWILSNSPVLYSVTVTRVSEHFTNGHPIENLIAEKHTYFAHLLAKQSKTVDEAVTEYQRRYQRRPPAGFDQWFELAQQHDFVLPDEFDAFMQSLEPYNGIHPAILQQRIENVWSQFDVIKRMLARFTIESGKLTIDDTYNTRRNELHVLSDPTFIKIIPYNVTFLVNSWDEPMVNSPWDEVEKALKDARDPNSERFGPDIGLTYMTPLIDSSKQSGWAATRQACPIDSPARQNICHARTHKDALEFISNISTSINICQNCELRDEHSLLLDPESLFTFHELVPIWSVSKPSHFNDVLVPSYWYFSGGDNYEPQSDAEWKDKDSIFYWVGSTTGGRATAKMWERMQRQRLVLTMSQRPETPIQLLEQSGPDPNHYSPSFTTMADVADLFSVRISAVIQCDVPACAEENEAFKPAEGGRASKAEAYAHRFVIDIDGNGFSGRFYRLLRSNSVVVKSTILREWHDDRLIPWVHYVPLSMNFQELPEMARFLATTERGLELSERIARESSEWCGKILRQVDLHLVFLRMILEYGRVLNPDLTY